MKFLVTLLFMTFSLSFFAQEQQKDTTSATTNKAFSTKKETSDKTVTKKDSSTASKKASTTNENKSASKRQNNNASASRRAQKKEVNDDPSLKGQFDYIYRTSTTYTSPTTNVKYKVVNIEKYNNLKRNVLDSVKNANATILDKEKMLDSERGKINSLNTELVKTQEDLKMALTKENSILLFGAPLSKVTYNLILWSIILIVSSLLTYFIFRFSRSNVLTKKAQENLKEVEEEFEIHRRKSLEREQKLRRKLQDEINKQRNV